MRNVAAVILAAGGSSRLGRPKQLVNFEGDSLIARAVTAAIDSGCSPVVVVVGAEADRVRAEMKDSPVQVIENRDWKQGIGSTICSGIDYLLGRAEPDAVALLACDQPFVTATTISSLILEYEGTKKPIMASGYSGTAGIPALFSRAYFEALRALPGGSGAKPLIEQAGGDVGIVQFEEGAIDIDTPRDYEALIRRSPS